MNPLFKRALTYSMVFAGGLFFKLLGFHQQILLDEFSFKRDTYIGGLRVSSEVMCNCENAYKLACKRTHQKESRENARQYKIALVRLPYGKNWFIGSNTELLKREQAISDYVKRRYEEKGE